MLRRFSRLICFRGSKIAVSGLVLVLHLPQCSSFQSLEEHPEFVEVVLLASKATAAVLADVDVTDLT